MSQRAFHNPSALGALLDHFGVWELGSLMKDMWFEDEEYYDNIRREQDEVWANERVQRGIKHAKAKKFQEALKCYDQALSQTSCNSLCTRLPQT